MQVESHQEAAVCVGTQPQDSYDDIMYQQVHVPFAASQVDKAQLSFTHGLCLQVGGLHNDGDDQMTSTGFTVHHGTADMPLTEPLLYGC